jgi:hypothetical protein
MRSGAYVSPVVRAREIVAEARAGKKTSRPAVSNARKILRIEPVVAGDLEKAKVPYKSFRWVAWGKNATERRRKADLVLHLRVTITTSRGGWLCESDLEAARAVLQAGIDEARRRGLAQPRPQDLPSATYAAAIRAARRERLAEERAPKRAARSAPPARVPLTKEEERTALAALAALPLLERLLGARGGHGARR